MRIAGNDAARKAWNYSLFDAIFNRRSRRFSMGAEIPGGPTKYRSDKPPHARSTRSRKRCSSGPVRASAA